MLIIPRRRVAAGATDPSYASVCLLLPCTGANNSTAIIDYSPTTKTATAYNSAKIVTGVADPWGDTSRGVLYLPTATATATDSSLSAVSVAHSSQFNFGSGDFTVELWYYPLAQSDYSAIISRSATDFPWMLYHASLLNNGNPRLAVETTNGFDYGLLASNALLAGWNHLAVTRASGAFRLFNNGTLVSTSSSLTGAIANSASPLWIGRNALTPNIRTLQAYYSNIRMTTVARYTSSFTVPSGPFPTS